MTREIDKLNAEVLASLGSEEERQHFLEGLKVLNMDNPEEKEALRNSVRKLCPDFTPEMVETFIEGRGVGLTESFFTQ